MGLLRRLRRPAGDAPEHATAAKDAAAAKEAAIVNATARRPVGNGSSGNGSAPNTSHIGRKHSMLAPGAPSGSSPSSLSESPRKHSPNRFSSRSSRPHPPLSSSPITPPPAADNTHAGDVPLLNQGYTSSSSSQQQPRPFRHHAPPPRPSHTHRTSFPSPQRPLPKNSLPPGMPPMPEQLVGKDDGTGSGAKHADQRRVSSIDRGFGVPGAREKTPSLGSRSSKGSLREGVSRAKRRVKRIFRRPGAQRDASNSSSNSCAASVNIDDVPEQLDFTRESAAGITSAISEMFAFRTEDVPSGNGAASVSGPYDYAATELAEEPAQSRLYRNDLSTKGKYIAMGEQIGESIRIHDNYLSFVVPPGWAATRATFGFYLSRRSALGFIFATSAMVAANKLLDTGKLSVLSEVSVISSPVFESRHKAVVKYAAHDIEGRGVAQYDRNFYPGAVVFGLCAPRCDQQTLKKVEERLSSSAVVLQVPQDVIYEKQHAKALGEKSLLADPSSILKMSNGMDCVMQ